MVRWLQLSWLKVSLAVLALVLLTAFFLRKEKLTHLAQPDIKKIASAVSHTMELSGLAYPHATVSFYIDGTLHDTGTAGADGVFTKILHFDKSLEGQHALSVTQSHKGIKSDTTTPAVFEVDVTPPVADLSITKFEFNKGSGTVHIEGTTLAPKVYINGVSTAITGGVLSVTQKVQEGNNVFSFVLADDVDNKTEVVATKELTIDTLPPKIDTTSFCDISLKYAQEKNLTQEQVCLRNGEFWGYFPTTYSMPIEGSVTGSLKLLSLNGKHIAVDTTGKIFQKVPLYMNWGTNKYKIVAEDASGNRAEEFLTIEVYPDSDNEVTDDEILDRIDDLESQIQDLEDR